MGETVERGWACQLVALGTPGVRSGSDGFGTGLAKPAWCRHSERLRTRAIAHYISTSWGSLVRAHYPPIAVGSPAVSGP